VKHCWNRNLLLNISLADHMYSYLSETVFKV